MLWPIINVETITSLYSMACLINRSRNFPYFHAVYFLKYAAVLEKMKTVLGFSVHFIALLRIR